MYTPLLPLRPERATRSSRIGNPIVWNNVWDYAPEEVNELRQVSRAVQQKRHIASLIEMLRQYLRCVRRSETANGTNLHAQYLAIGHTMVSAIVEQEHVLQTQYMSTATATATAAAENSLEFRRRYYYQSSHFNLLNLQESLLERNLVTTGPTPTDQMQQLLELMHEELATATTTTTTTESSVIISM
jgi:hypothetical protein